jgi:CMP-N-acetylneuraminic acid synthetase
MKKAMIGRKDYSERSEKLALIPARCGSGRIPGKNIKVLNGKPLISYTIEAAQRARFIDRIIITTDSEEIASVAKTCGAEVPFLRPRSISQSDSTEMQFLEHALDWLLEHESYEPDLIVLLYPTSPLRRPESIDAAIQDMIKHPEADSLRSVKLCSDHPYKMWVMAGEYLQPFVKTANQNSHTLSYQLLPTVYIQNASIYITKPRTIREKGSPTGDIIVPFIMDELESLDINTPLDFRFVEMLIKG